MVILMFGAFGLAIGADADTKLCELLEALSIERGEPSQRAAHRQHRGQRTDAILHRRVTLAEQGNAMVVANFAILYANQRCLDDGRMLGPGIDRGCPRMTTGMAVTGRTALRRR
jgi:hypothetical protein